MGRILITNDDSVTADGIIRLAAAASAFGEVWVVAPHKQRSAASHCITLHRSFDVVPCAFPVEGVHAFSCTGMPGDCVRVGCLNIVPGKPDVVLAGINHGYNVAADIQYSGTVGAALEARFQGIPAIALSEDHQGLHEVTDAYLMQVLEELLPIRPDPGQIINVNFPGCPLTECRGILRGRTISKAVPFLDRYFEQKQIPGGGATYMVKGTYQEEAEEGSDFRAVIDGCISIGFVNNIGYGV